MNRIEDRAKDLREQISNFLKRQPQTPQGPNDPERRRTLKIIVVGGGALVMGILGVGGCVLSQELELHPSSPPAPSTSQEGQAGQEGSPTTAPPTSTATATPPPTPTATPTPEPTPISTPDEPPATPTTEPTQISQAEEEYSQYAKEMLENVRGLQPSQINQALKRTSLRYSMMDQEAPTLGEVVVVTNYTQGIFGRPRPGYPEMVVTCSERDYCSLEINTLIVGARIVPLSDNNPRLNGTPIALVDFIIFDSKGHPMLATGYLGNLPTDSFRGMELDFREAYPSLNLSTKEQIPVIPRGGGGVMYPVGEIVDLINKYQGHVGCVGQYMFTPSSQNLPFVRQIAEGAFPPELFADFANKSRAIGNALLNGKPEDANLSYLPPNQPLTLTEVANMFRVANLAFIKGLPSFLEAAQN